MTFIPLRPRNLVRCSALVLFLDVTPDGAHIHRTPYLCVLDRVRHGALSALPFTRANVGTALGASSASRSSGAPQPLRTRQPQSATHRSSHSSPLCSSQALSGEGSASSCQRVERPDTYKGRAPATHFSPRLLRGGDGTPPEDHVELSAAVLRVPSADPWRGSRRCRASSRGCAALQRPRLRGESCPRTRRGFSSRRAR